MLSHVSAPVQLWVKSSACLPSAQRCTGTTIWSPLASGLLSGKYGKDNIPEGSRFSLDQYKVRAQGRVLSLLPTTWPVTWPPPRSCML